MGKRMSLIVVILFSVAAYYLLNRPIGPLPAPAIFFDPIVGFWANAETGKTTGTLILRMDEISEPVDIFFDTRGVPHIFAQNDQDLYFAQGYVTARDRLFQMELQIRAAGGYLSEWLGDDLLPYDRHQRRLGMVYGAERAIETILDDGIIKTAIESYSAGVNSYIRSLEYQNYPLEYKILGVSPQEWTPMYTALLLKYMTQMLAGNASDVETTNTAAHLGFEFVDRYISARSSLMDPIIPPGTEWSFTPIETEKPETFHLPSYTNHIEPWKPHPHNGSNNWVVEGARTAGGYPILSNDMHLNMTMPSIWYEAQLWTPEHNVYGVTLQGTPTIIVGFNEYIAWGSTNTGADVMDWYEITFQDEGKTHYLYDGEWLPVTNRIETIASKSGAVLNDTIRFTHHGPVYETVRETPLSETHQKNLALRWAAHDPSNELSTFYQLNRAKNVDDFREAFRSYQAPAQNMNYAGIDGNIAIQTGGRFPVKWEHQGRTVGDGSDSRYSWNEFVPFDQNPFSVNPLRGFLSAANQYPSDEKYPYYLGDDFAPYERGRRVNDLLREMENTTAEDFKSMLMDNFSYHAYNLLPVLLERIEPERSKLELKERELLQELSGWNYHNDGDQIAPSLFSIWWVNLYNEIWDNKFEPDIPMRRPSRDNTLDLILHDPVSVMFNNIQTQERETLDDLIFISYKKAIEELTERFGDSTENWLWGYVNRTNLNHLGQIPGMGVTNVFTGGGAESINAIFGSHGPSWRMVVELDPEGVRGYGVYPGGQSGNPGSKTYDEFVETWRTGGLYELLFLRDKPEASEEFPLSIQINPRNGS
jgi:penicillin G amidase